MARVPHRLIEGCLIAAHAIESTDVFIYIRGEYLTEYEILQAAVDEARAAGLFGDVEITVLPRRRRVHLRRGDGAARLARGPARPAAASAAVPAGAGPLQRADADQQRLHDRHRALDPRAGRSRVRQDRLRELARHGDLLDLGQRRAARQLRARARARRCGS